MEILLAGGSTKPAKDLKVGDKLETLHQNTLAKGEHEVSYFRVVESPLLDLIFSNKTFKCSEEDLFYSPSKESWVKATELKKGDKVAKLDGELEFESSKKLGKGKSIELTVEGAHTYVCDGVLLHNKGRKSKAKTYSQADVDAMKTQWATDSAAQYDKRYAGDKQAWETQRDTDKAAWEKDYSDKQKTLYDDKFATAKGDWHTAAEKQYDDRFNTAKGDWQTASDAAYDDRFNTAKADWQSTADAAYDDRFATAQGDWQAKYGALEDDWTKKYEGQSDDYDEKLRQEKAAFRHENESRLDLLGRYETLTGDYDKRDKQYGDLEKDYRKKGRQYSTLEGDYSALDKRYGLLTGDYSNLQNKYGALDRDYRKQGTQYDTLSKDYENLQRGGRNDGRAGLNPIIDEFPITDNMYRGEEKNGRGEERPASSGSSRQLSDDAQRYALLTGDYSALDKKYEQYR